LSVIENPVDGFCGKQSVCLMVR